MSGTVDIIKYVPVQKTDTAWGVKTELPADDMIVIIKYLTIDIKLFNS